MPQDTKAALRRADEVVAASKASRAAMAARSSARRRAMGLPVVKPATDSVRDAEREMRTAVREMRAEIDRRLTPLERRAGRRDPLSEIKADRLSHHVGDMETRLRAMTRPGTSHGTQSGTQSSEMKAYTSAFVNYVRTNNDGELRRLAPKARTSTLEVEKGGFLVPEQMESTITRVLADTMAMRSLASTQSITTQTLKKPYNMGGASTGWVGEKETRPETTTPTIKVMQFDVHEIYAMPGSTQTLLDDATVDIEGWLTNEIAIAFMEQEGNAFLTGNGANQPFGLLNYPTKAQTTYADYDNGADFGKIGYIKTGAAADFAAANPADVFVDMLYLMKSASLSGARWLMNRATAAKIRKFKIGTGEYLWEQSFQGGQLQPTLLGYPVEFDDYMPPVGANKFPVAFGDFGRTYLIVDRAGITTIRDNLTSKPNVLFYTTKRVGGGVQEFEHMKFIKCEA